MGGESLVCMRIELAGVDLPFDSGIKLRCIESLEPGAKPSQLAGGKLFDGLFNIFGGGHVGDIALASEVEKGGMRLIGWMERSDTHPMG